MNRTFPAIVAALSLALASPAFAQPLQTESTSIDLGRVVGGATVERVLTVRNPGPEPVRIRDVQLTPPLSVTRMKSSVAPGQTSTITIRLGTPRPAGAFAGQVFVNFDGDHAPLVVDVSATLVPAIELRPRPELVAVTARGTAASDSLEIVNHLDEPIRIRDAESSNERWSTDLEPVEDGRRWRLTLRMGGQGPAGRRTETLTLHTDHPAHPIIPVRVRTALHERVYTFPERVEFGRLVAGSVDANRVALYETSVMVYQAGGKAFQVEVSTDVPFLVVRPEKSKKFPDRWQIFLSIDPARLEAGQRGGTLTIETNDDDFPRLVVPVEAVVVGNGAPAAEPARAMP